MRRSLKNNGCLLMFVTIMVSMVVTGGFWWFVVWGIAKLLNLIL